MSFATSIKHPGGYRFLVKLRAQAFNGFATSAKIPYYRIKELSSRSAAEVVNTIVNVKGWIKTCRSQKDNMFIELNDGSTLTGIQIIVDNKLKQPLSFNCGASLDITGKLVLSPAKGQVYEILAKDISEIGPCPGGEYPLQKKRHSLEFLRTIAHLRPRTNTIGAIARVRSKLVFATHKFFQERGFICVHTPLITSSDCEGAGKMFRVTTLARNCKDSDVDFFGDDVHLTVSGQLSAEAYACSLGKVYTFGPTFRAENSHTTRHLAEFHMIEPEIAFCDLQCAMDNAEDYVKSVTSFILTQSNEELQFFNNFYDNRLLERLNSILNTPFVRISYEEALIYLQEEISKNISLWKYPDLVFGSDFHSEHERWLSETKFNNSCVFVHNYPRKLKAFYMRDNDDKLTVDSFDLLVPGIGELIGGSQREDRYHILINKMKEFNINTDSYKWYLDLRRFGTVPHAGYGVGFERLVCLLTSTENIRDAIAFPRTPNSCEY